MAKRVKFEYPNLPEELQEFANPKFGDVPLEDEMFAGYVNHTSRFSNDMRKFLETNGLATLGVQFEFLPKVRIYYDFFRIYWPREREGLREWFRLNYPELVNAFDSLPDGRILFDQFEEIYKLHQKIVEIIYRSRVSFPSIFENEMVVQIPGLNGRNVTLISQLGKYPQLFEIEYWKNTLSMLSFLNRNESTPNSILEFQLNKLKGQIQNLFNLRLDNDFNVVSKTQIENTDLRSKYLDMLTFCTDLYRLAYVNSYDLGPHVTRFFVMWNRENLTVSIYEKKYLYFHDGLYLKQRSFKLLKRMTYVAIIPNALHLCDKLIKDTINLQKSIDLTYEMQKTKIPKEIEVSIKEFMGLPTNTALCLRCLTPRNPE